MKPLQLGTRTVGPGQPALVIAEVGVNHNGDPGMALALVEAAHAAQADCVKFQTFSAGRVATAAAPKAPYQDRTTGAGQSQLDMIKALELPLEAWAPILRRCRELDIAFLSTPANIEDVDYLETLGVSAYKTASFQVVEPAFLRYVARTGKPMFVSTGMATMGEIERAVTAIRETGNDRLILLQCTTNYPSLAADANLRAMHTLQVAFDVQVGYSDHVEGDACCLAAVALGAPVIEKHLTLDRSLPGPDHAASASPDEFSRLVRGIREVEAALGSSVKTPSDSERLNRPFMRRSITTRVPIPAGTTVTEAMLTVKRPGTGIPAADMDQVVGARARTDLDADRVLAWADLDR